MRENKTDESRDAGTIGGAKSSETGDGIDGCCVGESELAGAAGVGAEAGRDLPRQHLRAVQSQGRHADLAVTGTVIPALTLCVNTRMTPSNMARTALMPTF